MRRAPGRLVLAFIDQGLSSGQNFLLLYLVIRNTNAVGLGAFSLAYAAYFLIQAMTRGLVGDTYTLTCPDETADRRRMAVEAAGAAVMFGLACAIVSAGIGSLTSGEIRVAFLCLAALLPGLLLQDSYRLLLFADMRASAAVLNDILFVIIQLSIYMALLIHDLVGMGTLIIGWGVAASCSALFGCWQYQNLPAVRQSRHWFMTTSELGVPLTLDYAVNRGAEQATLVAQTAVGSLSLQGAISASRAFFAPLTTVQTALNLFVLPEMVRARRNGKDELARWLAWAGGLGMAAVMAAAGLGVIAIPDDWGRAVFAQNWDPTKPVLLPMVAFVTVNGLNVGLWLGARAMGLARQTLAIRSWTGLLMVALAASGASISAAASVWGMVAAISIQTVWFARLLHRPVSPLTNRPSENG